MSSRKREITPDDVLRYSRPTEEFLCPMSANTYGIEFLSFRIRDVDSNATVFEVSKSDDAPAVEYPEDFDYDQLRSIDYSFPAEFLALEAVGTTLRFKVGDNEVRDFRMIERHYHRGRLIKSYDFNFNFCIPNSVNEWDAVYDMPPLEDAEIDNLIRDGAISDSFYFVEDQLIMHNKATYTYDPRITINRSNKSSKKASKKH